MGKTIKVALAGAGAFGIKHLDAIKLIDGVEVVSLVSRELAKTKEVADKYGIGHVTTDLADSLALKEVDAVILCTPTQMHAAQAIACMNAGKHVQVEIPLADSWADSEAVLAKQKETGLVCMVGHTRRFNPSHQYVHNRIKAGELNVQQMDVQAEPLGRVLAHRHGRFEVALEQEVDPGGLAVGRVTVHDAAQMDDRPLADAPTGVGLAVLVADLTRPAVDGDVEPARRVGRVARELEGSVVRGHGVRRGVRMEPRP